MAVREEDKERDEREREIEKERKSLLPKGPGIAS
jgi:hypothetical protein